MKGLVTVIIPAYNHAKFIEETLQSVVDQTYPDIEIIVMDDGSTDDTFRVAQEFQKSGARPMTVLHQSNGGTAKANQAAFPHAKGEFVRFLASDDQLVPDAVEWQVQDLIEHDADAVYGSFIQMFADGPILHDEVIEHLDDWDPQVFKESHIIGKGPLVQCGLYRTELIRAIGGPDQGYALDDWPMHFAVADAARRIRVHVRAAIRYRVHAGSLRKTRVKEVLGWKKAVINASFTGQARRHGLGKAYHYASVNLKERHAWRGFGHFVIGLYYWPNFNRWFNFFPNWPRRPIIWLRRRVGHALGVGPVFKRRKKMEKHP